MTQPTLRPTSDYLEWRIIKHVSSVFDGGTASKHGRVAAVATPTYTIFTVTGDVIVHALWGVVNTALVGASTLEVGVTGNTPSIITQYANVSVSLNLNGVFVNTVDTDKFGASLGVVFRDNGFVINGNGTDIIETSGTANITDGQIDYYCIWAPAESGANLINSGALS